MCGKRKAKGGSPQAPPSGDEPDVPIIDTVPTFDEYDVEIPYFDYDGEHYRMHVDPQTKHARKLAHVISEDAKLHARAGGRRNVHVEPGMRPATGFWGRHKEAYLRKVGRLGSLPVTRAKDTTSHTRAKSRKSNAEKPQTKKQLHRRQNAIAQQLIARYRR